MNATVRVAADGALGLLPFDTDVGAAPPPRLNIIWLENQLDCRTWSYYCDLRTAMAKLHRLCTPVRGSTCLEPKRNFAPQLVVVGPRYSTNVAHDDETLGFDRAQHASLPLAVFQNKMYAATTREIVGDPAAKLRWARAAGAMVGFTWLTRHHEFTRRSGVPHHWLPFGVDAAMYGRYAGQLGRDAQPIDIGFTGASSHKYPLRDAILREIGRMNVSSYLGTWEQTALNRADNRSWKALDREAYVRQLSRARMWVSTTGPSDIVGTRYFEVLASGTTLLLCNRPRAGRWVYDGLFEDGEHVVLFDGPADLRSKVLHYARDEAARQRIVMAAHALVQRLHTWDARARFVTRAVQVALARHGASAPYAPPPTTNATGAYLGCFAASARTASDFKEVRSKRPLRRFTVASCMQACRKARRPHVALTCGGFCSGNGHKLGRCSCAARARIGEYRKLRGPECATACSLRDGRPCGGHDAMAVYSMEGNGSLSLAMVR